MAPDYGFKMPHKINVMEVLKGQKAAMSEGCKQRNLERNITSTHVQRKIIASTQCSMLFFHYF